MQDKNEVVVKLVMEATEAERYQNSARIGLTKSAHAAENEEDFDSETQSEETEDMFEVISCVRDYNFVDFKSFMNVP